MSRELFGTDGVRGHAGQYPLDDATVKTIGMAVGSQFADGDKTFLVGQDPRESSPEITAALVEGLTAVGCKVKLVGIIPTPGLAYLVRSTDAAAGVMITASHNPYTDNGIKVFRAGGQKLTDAEETELNRAISQAKFAQAQGSSEDDHTLIDEYVKFLVETAKNNKLDGLKIAVDCANGAASETGPKIFETLGAEVTALFNQPNGRNINDGCGATDIEALKAIVLKNKLDAGVAFDGDADRLMMVDSQGREFNGDHIIYLLAVTYGVPAVATTIMSNYGLEKSLAAEGINLHRTQVGDRYVLDELRAKNLKLGGEQSGHIVINDLQPTGDGLLAAIQVLVKAKQSGKNLASWRDEVELLPQHVINLAVKDKTMIDAPEIQEYIKSQSSALAGTGRLLVRASGTEPKVRVMVEGPDAQSAAESISAELAQMLK